MACSGFLHLVWRPHLSADGFLGCTKAKHHIFDLFVEGQLVDVLVDCRNVAGRRHDVYLLAGDSHSPWLSGVAKVECGCQTFSSSISGTRWQTLTFHMSKSYLHI